MQNAREAARAAGERKYFTGKPCQNGHIDTRNVATGLCRACIAANFQKWRAANIEKDRAKSLAWQKNNRERVIAAIAKREASVDQRTPSWADLDRIQGVYRESRRLSETTGIAHHVDHVIPLHGRLVSGLHVHENLRPIPAHENKRKSNLFPVG